MSNSLFCVLFALLGAFSLVGAVSLNVHVKLNPFVEFGVVQLNLRVTGPNAQSLKEVTLFVEQHLIHTMILIFNTTNNPILPCI